MTRSKNTDIDFTLHFCLLFFCFCLIKSFIVSSIYKGNTGRILYKNRRIGLKSRHLQFG